jgi:small subunit ribosomal protein SAe
MLTNQITKTFFEPRLLILTDPRLDINALKESSYVNIPIIALCNTDNNLGYVDCAIPCNNRSPRSLAMVYWLLTREVLRLKKVIKEDEQLEEMVDLFVFRDPNKKEQEKVADEEQPQQDQPYDENVDQDDEGEANFIGN